MKKLLLVRDPDISNELIRSLGQAMGIEILPNLQSALQRAQGNSLPNRSIVKVPETSSDGLAVFQTAISSFAEIAYPAIPQDVTVSSSYRVSRMILAPSTNFHTDMKLWEILGFAADYVFTSPSLDEEIFKVVADAQNNVANSVKGNRSSEYQDVAIVLNYSTDSLPEILGLFNGLRDCTLTAVAVPTSLADQYAFAKSI